MDFFTTFLGFVYFSFIGDHNKQAPRGPAQISVERINILGELACKFPFNRHLVKIEVKDLRNLYDFNMHIFKLISPKY